MKAQLHVDKLILSGDMGALLMPATCECGHELDEHADTESSTPPCEVKDCDCFAYEAAE